MAKNSQARRTRRWAVPTRSLPPLRAPMLKGQWRDSPETKAGEPQRPGAAPLWGWKTRVQHGSPLGLEDWDCRVASLQHQAARAAVQLLPLFFSSQFPSKATVPAVVALTVRRLIFHKQQSSLPPPPSCCPLLYLKGRGLHGWRQKHPTPTPAGLCPQKHRHKVHCPHTVPTL